MEEDEPTVVRGDKEEWLNHASPCSPAAKYHAASVRKRGIGSWEGGGKNILQSAEIVTVDAS